MQTSWSGLIAASLNGSSLDSYFCGRHYCRPREHESEPDRQGSNFVWAHSLVVEETLMTNGLLLKWVIQEKRWFPKNDKDYEENKGKEWKNIRGWVGKGQWNGWVGGGQGGRTALDSTVREGLPESDASWRSHPWEHLGRSSPDWWKRIPQGPEVSKHLAWLRHRDNPCSSWVVNRQSWVLEEIWEWWAGIRS